MTTRIVPAAVYSHISKKLGLSRILLSMTVLLGSTTMFSSPVFAEEAAEKAEPVYLTGNWGGVRNILADKGVIFNASETLDVLGNVTGGVRHDAVIQGAFLPSLDVDFEKLAGVKGLLSHVSAYQIHGRGLSANNLNNNIATSTGIEANRATRLFELWVQQTLADGKVSVRAGELAADQEFTTSQYSALFMNSTYGWPSSIAANMPGGGPGYPLAAPGVRVRVGESDPWSFQIGLFDGDASGKTEGATAQDRNPNGTRFPLNHGALVMSEVAYNRAADEKTLPATYKLGMWYDSEDAADPRYGTDNLSLADTTNSNGIAQQHHGNYGVYGVIDQGLWHSKTVENRGVASFLRVFWNPDDRNTVSYQVDAGLNFTGMIPGREDDVFGIAGSFLPLTDRISGFDRDTNFFNSTTAPVRNYEAVIEATYQAPLTDWLMLQPDFQYIIHPGGGVADPADDTKTVGNAAIFGLRTVIKF